MNDKCFQEIRKAFGMISGVHIESVEIDEPFIDFSSRFSSNEGCVLLLSGGSLDSARFHILAVNPWLCIKSYKKNITITIDNKTFKINSDPFEFIKKIIDLVHINLYEIDIPVVSGLFGYFSYDLKDHIESLHNTSINDLNLPDMCLYAPSAIVVRDKKKGKNFLCVPERTVSNIEKTQEYSDLFFKQKQEQKPKHIFNKKEENGVGFKSDFSKTEYIDSIEKIKEYIASGHVYQVNMSQRFEKEFYNDPYLSFKKLYLKNPAPFFSYINAKDHHIISTSPERFVLQTGSMVETRPIKGTRPRGKTEKEDKKLKLELLFSKKDDAELSMIVDLLRNDLGKICKFNTVCVVEHKRLEGYENVYHLVSVIRGELADGKDSIDILKATFPGGSITGCPKVRAMEIIDELEVHRRHIYTGSTGYISFHNSMDLSIAIRTAVVYNNKIYFSAGGGIVYDSDPLDEYRETLVKGKTLMDVLSPETKKIKEKDNTNYLWINGLIQKADNAYVPVSDFGFLYGYGFFETIRADKGEIKYLKEHIMRLNKTWECLFNTTPPDLSWEYIIKQVIEHNKFTEKTAAIKIIATYGNNLQPPLNNLLAVLLRPYTHRLINKEGINLGVYKDLRHTPLASFKTLNYLYYFLAGQWASKNGYDEALVMNFDKTVSETNTANIVLLKNNEAILPCSSYVLPGIMEREFCRFLESKNYVILRKKLQVKDLFSADHVFLTNSLMGVVPVISVDKKPIAYSSSFWKQINKIVINEKF